MTDTTEYPGSVKQFTHQQFASAFIKLAKNTNIARTPVPKIQSLDPELRRIASWVIDGNNASLQGIGKLTNAVLQIILYSKKTQHLVDNRIEFTRVQMESIAKRVFELIANPKTSYFFHQELEYAIRPKEDHIKKTTGGNYVLQNSSRDRRYKSESNNFSLGSAKPSNNNSELTNINAKSNSSASRYVAPNSHQNNNSTAPTTCTKTNQMPLSNPVSLGKQGTLYKPPCMRNDMMGKVNEYTPRNRFNDPSNETRNHSGHNSGHNRY